MDNETPTEYIFFTKEMEEVMVTAFKRDVQIIYKMFSSPVTP